MSKTQPPSDLVVTDYHKYCRQSSSEDYSYACLVYKSTAEKWQLHIHIPTRTAQRMEVKTSAPAPNTWLVTEPINLSENGSVLINRYNNGLHGTFAFTTDDKEAVFYIKELVFFTTFEQAALWTVDEYQFPPSEQQPIVISMRNLIDTQKNGVVYRHLSDPSQTGNWEYDESEQALAVTYTEKEFIIGEYNVGNYRFAPRFTEKNMLNIYPGHRHSYSELNVLQRGEMEVTCGADVFRLKAGDLILIPEHTFHYTHSIGDTISEMVTVHYRYQQNNLTSPRILTMNENEQDLFRIFCCDIEDKCQSEYDEGVLTLNNTAKKLFEVFFEYVTTNQSNPRRSSDKDAVIYNSAVEYMNANISGQLKVSQVAKKCAICQTKLKHIFNRYASVGVIEFFSGLKLERARELLLSGKECAEVSDELGFSSPAYFSKRFKQQYGVSPSKIKSGKNRIVYKMTSKN